MQAGSPPHRVLVARGAEWAQADRLATTWLLYPIDMPPVLQLLERFPEPLLPPAAPWRAWLGQRLQPWEAWSSSVFLDAWVALEWDWYGVPRTSQLRRAAYRAPVVRPYAARWSGLPLLATDPRPTGTGSPPAAPLWSVLADLWALHTGIQPQVAAGTLDDLQVDRRAIELVIRPTWASMAPWQESVRIAGDLLQDIFAEIPRRPSQAVLRVAHGRLAAIARGWDATWGRGWVAEDDSVRWIGEQHLVASSAAEADPAAREFRPFDWDGVLQPIPRSDPLGLTREVAWVHGAVHHVPEEWQTLAHWVRAGRADRLEQTAIDGEAVLALRRWRPHQADTAGGLEAAETPAGMPPG